MDMNEWVKRILAGVVMGIGMVLPGVSGSVIAVSMGLYEPMLSAISHFFKDIRGNLRLLVPIGLGMGLGVLMVARALAWLMANAQAQVVSLFVGLVLGGLPALWREANGDLPFKPSGRMAGRVLWLLAGFGLTQLVNLLESQAGSQITLLSITGPQALLSGGIYAFGTIIPGISSSFLLIYLGYYQALLESLLAFRLPVLLCSAAGFGLIALLLIRVVEWCFKRHGRVSYNLVLGFVLGSIALLLSMGGFGTLWLLNAALFGAGIALAFFVGHGFGTKPLE